MQHTLVDQRGHRAVDGRQVGRLGAGGQRRAQPLVDLGHRQVAVDGLEHRQHLDSRRHPPQPPGPQKVTDPFGDDRVQGRLHFDVTRSVFRQPAGIASAWTTRPA